MKTIQGLALLLAGSALCSTQAVFAQTAPDTPAPVADTAAPAAPKSLYLARF